MNADLLHPEIQHYIIDNTGADTTQLALKRNPFPEVPFAEILNQIAARTKAREKLPTWFSAADILYPSKISLEQTSSEITAQYKTKLLSGSSLIDLTGGFGIDDYFFAQHMEKVVHCEMNAALQRIAQHNFKILNASNIDSYSGDSFEILKKLDTTFDWIYIDPSRRSDIKGKVFMLRECVPNVPELLTEYFRYADNILIKAAPILDLTSAINELQYVSQVHIVAVENEVRELLFVLHKANALPIKISTINFIKNIAQVFAFDDKEADSNYGLPAKYLYEPNSAIMKSGGFNIIGQRFGLRKLQQNSHLYTGDSLVDFPGRVFEIIRQVDCSKSELRKHIQNTKMNISTRNFPESVEAIRAKWKIKDGGDRYCFFTTDLNDRKIALICAKI